MLAFSSIINKTALFFSNLVQEFLTHF